MTSMIDKPLSTKAESFFRHNGTTDHGTRGNPGRDRGQFEYDTRAKRAAQGGVSLDEFDDIDNQEGLFDHEDQENKYKTDFNFLVEAYPDYLNVSIQFGEYLADFRKKKIDIDDLVPEYQLELERQTGLMPSYEEAEMLLYDLLADDPSNREEGRISDDAHLNYSEAELSIKSRAEINRAMARRATLDHDYSDDDEGDSDYNSPMRIHDKFPYHDKKK